MASISDDFNRANNATLGTAAGGWSWAEVSGNPDLFNNAAEFNAAGTARAESDLASADHYAQADLLSFSPGTIAGPMVRFAAAAETGYYAMLYSGDNNLYIGKLVASSETHLANAAATVSLPDTIKCEINGTTLTGYVNGANVVSTTDSSISSNTRAGIRNGRHDNFAAADLGAAAARPILIGGRLVNRGLTLGGLVS